MSAETPSPIHSPFQRWVSRLLIVTVTSLVMHPFSAAAQQGWSGGRAAAKTAEHHTLESIEEAVRAVVPEAWPGHQTGLAVTDEARAEAAQTLLGRLKAIEAEAEEVQAEFDQTGADLMARGLPEEILVRHRQTVAEFQQRREEFRRLGASVERAAGGKRNFVQRALGTRPKVENPLSLKSALTDLADFLVKHPNKRSHTPADPTKLPWGSPKGDVRAPIESATAYKLSGLFPHETVKLAANGSIQGIVLPASAGVVPTTDDLAATEDVPLTAEIKAQAAALHNNPVEIHNWVRNTVEFIPSYGSIQGAAMTLQTKRGNAFDTASLEIALLRAANIPARYVYGTIEVPIAKVMNWVGGVTTPGAAQNLLSQGGIPNVALVSGGIVSHIRMEHVWVEAYVDYLPSRGAKNVEGDTWVPLDPSFKQYQYKAGMDLKAKVPLDGEALLNQIKDGATVNEAEGWVQNLNQAKLSQALTDYQTRIKNYLDRANPDATVGDVLGTKTIVAESKPYLMGGLPCRVLATGSRFAAMPGNMQWKFRTRVTDGALDYFGDVTGNELVSLNRSTATLAGRKITLSFVPATQADMDLINSYLPEPHADGSPIQPSELPTSLPGYLLKLKAEIRVEGQLVSQSVVVATMGQTLTQITGFYNPATQRWEEGEANKPVAGDYRALGIDLQGTGQGELQALKAKLEATKAKLEAFQANPSDTTPIQNLTKEDLSGDLLYAGMLGYFASVDGSDQLAARSRGDIVNYRSPSYGAFYAGANPHYWFGIVKRVTFPGVTMDVDRLIYQTVAKDEDKAKKLAYLKQVGSAGSASEHAVPEKLFVDTSTCNAADNPSPDPNKPDCAQGVSAVKAIALAAAQGQKVYTLNPGNQAYHASIVQSLGTDADTKAEISNALAAGMEVTVHQADITVNGWTGSGYIMLDPDSGTGAYKISGGMSGGVSGFGCGVASGGLSYFFGIAYGVQHLLERSSDDPEKAIVAETVLGAAVYMFGNSAEFRASVMDMLWDNLDFIVGKILMGFLIGFALGALVGSAWITVPIAAVLQLFATLGYLLGVIGGSSQAHVCG